MHDLKETEAFYVYKNCQNQNFLNVRGYLENHPEYTAIISPLGYLIGFYRLDGYAEFLIDEQCKSPMDFEMLFELIQNSPFGIEDTLISRYETLVQYNYR